MHILLSGNYYSLVFVPFYFIVLGHVDELL